MDEEDNDADALIDINDPQCHTDLDPQNQASYMPYWVESYSVSSSSSEQGSEESSSFVSSEGGFASSASSGGTASEGSQGSEGSSGSEGSAPSSTPPAGSSAPISSSSSQSSIIIISSSSSQSSECPTGTGEILPPPGTTVCGAEEEYEFQTSDNTTEGNALRDQFNGVKPAFSTNQIKDINRAKIRYAKSTTNTAGQADLMLRNRALAVTKTEYPKVQIEFNFSWTQKADSPAYQDHLGVLLRSSGELNADWPHEGTNGILIKFNGNNKKAHVYNAATGEELASADVGLDPAGTDLKIIDDGSIKIYQGAAAQPAITVDSPSLPERGTKNHIGFYNREPTAAVWHEAKLTNLKITKLN